MKLKRANGGWEISHGVKTRWEPSFFRALKQIPEVRSEAHILNGENSFLSHCEPATPHLHPSLEEDMRAMYGAVHCSVRKQFR